MFFSLVERHTGHWRPCQGRAAAALDPQALRRRGGRTARDTRALGEHPAKQLYRDFQRWPQDVHKMASRWPQDGPRLPHLFSLEQLPQDGPNEAKYKPKLAPTWPQMAQYGSKIASKWRQDGQQMAQDCPTVWQITIRGECLWLAGAEGKICQGGVQHEFKMHCSPSRWVLSRC